MPGTSLDVVFNYLSLLISERDADKPFLISQLQPALTYKFPTFSFGDYKLAGLKDFVVMGEKSGYFKLVNTGSPQTSYLTPGTRQPPQTTKPDTGSLNNLPDNDPRRMRWMQLALENMMTADRADQLFDAIKGLDALTPSFDSFLAAQGHSAQQYPVRGKISRIRDFLKTVREQGEVQGRAVWQISRTVTRMPPIPPLENAAAAQSLIWSLMQGTTQLASVPLDKLNNMFFAVLTFSKKEMIRNRSFDWATGLELLDADARAVPRPAPPTQKRGLFGGGKPVAPTYELDDFEIEVLVEDLRKAAGIRATMTDQTAIWRAYLDAPTPSASVQFLNDQPNLLESDGLMNWLEEQIGENVAAGKMDAVKNLATKSAIVIVARQRKAGQPPDDLRALYDSIMDGAALLGNLFGYLDTTTTAEAAEYLRGHNDLMDQDAIGPLIEDQALKAARQNDVERYRRISERLDLWRNLIEFGMENGVQQHQRFLARARDDQAVEAEMGLMILVEAETVEDQRDTMERYPAVGSKAGLELVDGMLDMLSFHNDSDQYNKYHHIKRLIERCLEVGVDRALSELR